MFVLGEHGSIVEVITCAPERPQRDCLRRMSRIPPRPVGAETLERSRVAAVWTHLAANKGSTGRISSASFPICSRRSSSPGSANGRLLVVADISQFFCGWANTSSCALTIRRVPFVRNTRPLADNIVAVERAKNRRCSSFSTAWNAGYAGADHIVTVGEGY